MAEEYLNTNTFLCGVIEGFYGRPWTQRQRKELFKRMNILGMNSYLYAPKDDAKHRQMWREMYTIEESEEMQILINAAKAQGIEFIYAISPGLDIAFSSKKDVKTLKRKLEHMQQMGCRSFALLFDDIEPQLSAVDRDKFLSYAHAQVAVTNEIYQHLSSPPCFIFCPTEYCATRAVPDVSRSSYLNLIGSKLLPGIEIIWTGSKVIPREITLDSVHELARVLCRPPLLWDNLHANDYDQKRLFMGPYEGRSVQLIPYLRGVMTNPNCEFESNFAAMYTLAHWSRCVSESGGNNEEDSNQTEAGPLLINGTVRTYNARRALVCALQDWMGFLHEYKDIKGLDYTPFVGSVPPGTSDTAPTPQFSHNQQSKKKLPTSHHLRTKVKSRKSVAKGLLAVAKGSFPPAAAQEVVRVTQSAITLPTTASTSNGSSLAPTTTAQPIASVVAAAMTSNGCSSSATATFVGESHPQAAVDKVVQLCSLPNMHVMQDDPQMARSALHAAAVVAQVAVDEANIKTIQAAIPLIQVCMDSSTGEPLPAAMTALPPGDTLVESGSLPPRPQLSFEDEHLVTGDESTLTNEDTVIMSSVPASTAGNTVEASSPACCSLVTSTLVMPVTSIDSTVAVATKQAAILLEQSDEAQLLKLQNDPSLFPAPLSASPPVFTLTSTPTVQSGVSGEVFSFAGSDPHTPCSTNTAALDDLTSGAAASSTAATTTTTMVLLQPTSTASADLSAVLSASGPSHMPPLLSSVTTSGVVPMETDCERELNQLEQMDCQSIESLLTARSTFDDESSQHSVTFSVHKTTLQQQSPSMSNTNIAQNDEDEDVLSSCEGNGHFTHNIVLALPPPSCTLDDMCLLVDLFYLPYEFGPKAQLMLELLHWLRVNANLARGTLLNAPGVESGLEEQAQEINLSVQELVKLRQEWVQRATNFRQLVDAVRVLCEHLSGLPNRGFLFDVYPYLWDVRALLCMLETYILWLGRYPLPLSSCMILRRNLTWGTPGYKQTFMSGEHEPWMFRGGLISELQRMLPLEGSADLFPSRMPPPVLPPNSEQSPLLKSPSNSPSPSQTQSNSATSTPLLAMVNEPTPLVHMMKVRPYLSESERDRPALYQLCRRITWLRIHLDYAQQAGIHVNLATAVEDCFLKHQLPDLPGDRYLEGFLSLSPQYCFVVEDVQSDICGFALAATNAGEWFQAVQCHVYPRMRTKYPMPPPFTTEATPMQLEEETYPMTESHAAMDTGCSVSCSGSGGRPSSEASGSGILLDEEVYSFSVLQAMKAHFHVRELPPGYGRIEDVASSVTSNDKGERSSSAVTPTVLQRLYPALIHVDFLPTREVMLWHDDVAKRMLACLLAALRTNGITGVHCRLNRNEGSHIAFYRRYRFETIEVEGCDSGQDIILGRTI